LCHQGPDRAFRLTSWEIAVLPIGVAERPLTCIRAGEDGDSIDEVNGMRRQRSARVIVPVPTLPRRVAVRHAAAAVAAPTPVAAIDADHFLFRRSLRRLACRAAVRLALVELLRLLVLSPRPFVILVLVRRDCRRV